MEIPKVGVGIVVLKDSSLLLGRRKSSHGFGEWAPPGGHLEFGENPEECARRELLEETGMKAIEIVPGPWTNNFFETGKHYVTLYMFVTTYTGTPQQLESHKSDPWQWCQWDNLPQPLFPAFQALIDKAGIDALKIVDCY